MSLSCWWLPSRCGARELARQHSPTRFAVLAGALWRWSATKSCGLTFSRTATRWSASAKVRMASLATASAPTRQGHRKLNDDALTPNPLSQCWREGALTSSYLLLGLGEGGPLRPGEGFQRKDQT